MMWSYCSRSSAQDVLHIGGGQEFGDWRRCAPSEHGERGQDAGAHHGLLQGGVAGHTLLRPVLEPHAQGFVTAGTAQVGIDQKTRAPFWARTIAVLMLVVVFPSWGRALVIRITFGGPPRSAKGRYKRAVRFRHLGPGPRLRAPAPRLRDEATVRRLGGGLDTALWTQGNHAQRRQGRNGLGLFDAHGVVDAFQQECQADSGRKAESQREREIRATLGSEG